MLQAWGHAWPVRPTVLRLSSPQSSKYWLIFLVSLIQLYMGKAQGTAFCLGSPFLQEQDRSGPRELWQELLRRAGAWLESNVSSSQIPFLVPPIVTEMRPRVMRYRSQVILHSPSNWLPRSLPWAPARGWPHHSTSFQGEVSHQVLTAGRLKVHPGSLGRWRPLILGPGSSLLVSMVFLEVPDYWWEGYW